MSSTESLTTKTGTKEGAPGFAVSTGSKELLEPESSPQEPHGVPRHTAGQGVSQLCAWLWVVSAKVVKRRNSEKKKGIARSIIIILG